MSNMAIDPNKKRQSKKKNLESHDLQEIFNNLPDPIFVTDQEGNVLLSNSTTAFTMDMSLDQLLKSNLKELVGNGYYDRSYAMEAVEKKTVVSGILKTKLNIEMISTSTPVLDDKGEVKLVVTTSRPKQLMEKYSDSKGEKRKREIEYMRSYVLDKETVVAKSRSMQQVLLNAHSVAQTDSAVVLYGETGTGKEVLAKYIHRHSKRSNEAFIAVNCANFPEHLVESELFGYEKGAFTGANTEGKIGLFEAAERGTLFLDEIAELPMPLQSKLLRVLESGEVRRVGSYVYRKIDFRLIAATNKDLQKLAAEGKFREDLYYRLNVFPVLIPPLRERPDDIEALAERFLEQTNKKYGSQVILDASTMDTFKKYSWPGNVRELRNIIERKGINSLQDYSYDDISMAAMDALPRESPAILIDFSGSLRDVVRSVEKQYIRSVLEECDGRVSEAAKRLGIYRTVLYRKIKALKEEDTRNQLCVVRD